MNSTLYIESLVKMMMMMMMMLLLLLLMMMMIIGGRGIEEWSRLVRKETKSDFWLHHLLTE